jgi:hypothetical protein
VFRGRRFRADADDLLTATVGAAMIPQALAERVAK